MVARSAGTSAAVSAAAGLAGAGDGMTGAVGIKDRQSPDGMAPKTFFAGDGRISVIHRAQGFELGTTIFAKVFVNGHWIPNKTTENRN